MTTERIASYPVYDGQDRVRLSLWTSRHEFFRKTVFLLYCRDAAENVENYLMLHNVTLLSMIWQPL